MSCKYKYQNKWYSEEDINTLLSQNLSNLNLPSTRRILEIQSDLFQKGRDKSDLITTTKVDIDYANLSSFEIDGKHYYSGMGIAMMEPSDGSVESVKVSMNEYNNAKEEWLKINSKQDTSQNQFLQLLNKDNNWVTFFVKSIIQDSAKKGYEKVLFPRGETAAKVEGHETLANELTDINKELVILQENSIIRGKDGDYRLVDTNGKLVLGEINLDLLERKRQYKIENLEQRKSELKSQGIEKLKPIEAFYEIRITNLLKKLYKVNDVTDEYGNQWNEIDINQERDKQEILFQKPGRTESSIASPKTISMIKEFLKKIGVDIKGLENITINGTKSDANAVALIMQKLVQVVNGKEANSLPEEAMHFAVEIIKQKNPKLYGKLLNEINGYKILNTVFAEYGNDVNYQKDGKPDVIKLKEEAIGKILAETIIQRTEGSTEKPELLARVETWWQSIINFFKELFSKSGIDQVTMDVISGKFEGTAEEIKAAEDKIFMSQGTQEGIYNNYKNKGKILEERSDGYYNLVTGKKVPKRVSDVINGWYEKMFAEKKLLESEHTKAVNDLKKEKGTAGHADIEYAGKLFTDENGYLKSDDEINELIRNDNHTSFLNNNDNSMYKILRDNLLLRLKSFPKDTRFLFETIIYNPKTAIAGKVDFIAITPEGKVSKLDWKFMDINTEKYKDVPWYKVNAWNQQMIQYTLISNYAYGIKSEDFEQTRMIPIQAIYTEENAKTKTLPVLKSVKIGDVNVKNITEDYLLPVGIEGEKTGNEEIDILLEKLNAVYKKFSDKKVLPSDKKDKAEQLNALFSAIRQLQVKQNLVPLLHQAQILNKQITRTINTYNTKFVGADPKSFSEKEINDFTKEISDSLEAIRTYTRLDTELESLFPADMSKKDEELFVELTKTANDARRFETRLEATLRNYTADIIAKSVGTDKYLSPEKVIKGITRWLSTTSTLQLRSIEVLFKKANRAFTKAAFDTQSEIQRLSSLKKNYDEWAKRKGLSHKEYFDIIKKKNKNELIDEFDHEFYGELQRHIQDKDFQWIRDNINVPEYNEFLKKKLAEEIQRIKDKPDRILTESEIKNWEDNNILPNEIKSEISQAERLYNISTKESLGWLLNQEIKAFPNRDKWESKEWKELNKPENSPAKAFYDYIIERNKEYRELGYISNARTFLPFVRKSLTEKLITGGNVRFGEQFFRAISIDEGDIGYGKIDPLTGELINTIPKYFTSEIEGELSTDLFHTMAMYNEAALKYKYVSEIENQIRALVDVERTKEAIATSYFGKTKYKDGKLQHTKDNTENYKLVQDTMKAIIYGQRFIESETFDQLLFKLGTWGEKFNKKLGVKIFPEGLSERQVSVNKVINQFNGMFQLNILGLNVLSATSNLFGGNMQSIINAGMFFTKTDYIKAEGILFMNKFNGTDKKKLIGALNYFLPLTENYNERIAKQLSLNALTQEGIQDFLMVLMRKSDLNVETSNFYAYLFNTIVQDGKVVNAREYLRSLPEYEDKYKGTPEERKNFEQKFEEEVKKLIDEKGVLKLATIENNEFVIPGVDRKSDSVIEFRRKVQQLSKDSLGNLTPDDIRKISLNVYGKSFMIFKNWIPRLIDVRVGNLKYNNATDAYEWGRIRNVVRIMSDDLLGSIGNLRNSLIGNEKGIDYLRELYEKKKADYETDTGKTLNMTETQFMDLVRNNVRNQMYDVIFLTILMGLLMGVKANTPDPEEDENTKNQYRFMTRAIDKFANEIYYFYDPTSLTSLVSSSVFPSISLLDNFKKAIVNFGKENYGLFVGDEELLKKNYVIKYWMKSFPFTNQMIGYLPMFYPQLAKDLGVKIQANYSIKR